MPADQTFSTSDLRSNAQDSKRDAARKHKWALGSIERVGRGADNPRPYRPSETTYNLKRRETKSAVASLAHGTRVARKHDMQEGAAAASDESGGSSASSSDVDAGPGSPSADAGVAYSFDSARGPSQGSQILNVALARAVQRFEEKETVRLVKSEYDVLDSDGESIGLSPVKKNAGRRGARAGRARPSSSLVSAADDEEDGYEFV